MDNVFIQLAIAAFDPLAPLNNLFGWLTRILYLYFGNYGVAIIMLTIIISRAVRKTSIRLEFFFMFYSPFSDHQIFLITR